MRRGAARSNFSQPGRLASFPVPSLPMAADTIFILPARKPVALIASHLCGTLDTLGGSPGGSWDRHLEGVAVMSRHHWISVALLGGMMMAVGCEKSETPTTPAPA